MNALYFYLLTSRRLLFLVLLPIVWWGQTIVWWGQTIVWWEQTIVWWEQIILSQSSKVYK
ncbi:hypothetical protein [Alloprevotella tannerae]